MDYTELLWFSSFLGVFILFFLFSLFAARREIESLENEKSTLIAQVGSQQQLIFATREDTATWKKISETQCEDLHQQNLAYSSRLDSLELQLQQKQMEVEMARQMCRDLPASQARVIDLERMLVIERERIDSLVIATASATAPVLAASPVQEEIFIPEPPEPESFIMPEETETVEMTISPSFRESETLMQELNFTRTALETSQRKAAVLQQALALSKRKFRQTPKKARYNPLN